MMVTFCAFPVHVAVVELPRLVALCMVEAPTLSKPFPVGFPRTPRPRAMSYHQCIASPPGPHKASTANRKPNPPAGIPMIVNGFGQ